jgi:tetrahydromethanopterin S-methyltransferase subunit B
MMSGLHALDRLSDPPAPPMDSERFQSLARCPIATDARDLSVEYGPKDERMPLSEDEQRILDEIERSLHESDPRLAREVSEKTIYRHALGSLKWSVLGFVIGLALMVATLPVHFMLAFAGFLVMMISALGFERNLRVMGRAGIQQVSTAFRTANPNLGRQGEPSADGVEGSDD